MGDDDRRDEERRGGARRRSESAAGASRAGQSSARRPSTAHDSDAPRKPYVKRDGDAPRRPYVKRDGDAPRKPYVKRDGDAPRKPYVKRDGEAPRKPYDKRERGGSRPAHANRVGKAGGSAGMRGAGPARERGTSPRIPDPALPDDVTARDLHPSARNELRTLSKENADVVGRHLAMAVRVIDDEPALAHEHALAASRKAGRVAVVRESLAITAYAVGDFALALRELRTYRRISGRDDQIAMMVDSERGVGRPDRALEVGRAVERDSLPIESRVELAIAMSGARLDLGDPAGALRELDIPELDPDTAFAWSPGLFAARATVLAELGRAEESARWFRLAEVAASALDGDGSDDVVQIDEIEELSIDVDVDDPLPVAVAGEHPADLVGGEDELEAKD